MKTCLKREVDILQFLGAVDKCSGEVHFCTPEGDNLILNSALSQYFFAFLAKKEDALEEGAIVCENPQDKLFLQDYLFDVKE